jgi:hypothetical protein
MSRILLDTGAALPDLISDAPNWKRHQLSPLTAIGRVLHKLNARPALPPSFQIEMQFLGSFTNGEFFSNKVRIG